MPVVWIWVFLKKVRHEWKVVKSLLCVRGGGKWVTAEVRGRMKEPPEPKDSQTFDSNDRHPPHSRGEKKEKRHDKDVKSGEC
jgi:hypothetical protein